MNPYPHTTSDGARVLALDFAAGLVLVGDPVGRSDDSPIRAYRRLRFTAEGGVVERPVTGALNHGDKPPPDLADDLAWFKDRHVALVKAPTRIYPRRVFVSVDRTSLNRALVTMAKVGEHDPSGVDAALAEIVTLRVHPRGLLVVSHGAVECAASLPTSDAAEATDGLGVVVVSLASLRACVKQLAASRVEIVVGPVWREQVVTLQGRPLWTVRARPVGAPALPDDAVRERALTDAIARALGFASSDLARPTLHCVAFRGCEGYVLVEATDGYRAYRERVDGAHPFGCRSVTVPRTVLASLRKGKRAGLYSIACDGDDVIVECDGLLVRCKPGGHSFPPLEQVVSSAALEGHFEWIRREVTKAQCKAIADWLGGVDGTVGLQFGETAEDAPVAVRLTCEAYDLDVGKADFPTVCPPSAESTAYDLVRGYNASYLHDAFAVFPDGCFVSYDDGHAVRTSTIPPREFREPLYLHNETIVVITMPTKY